METTVNWYPMTYKASLFAGILCICIGMLTQNDTSFGATLAGYSLFAMTLMLLLINVFSVILSKNTTSVQQTGYLIMSTAGPFMLLLGVIGFVLYLMIYYKVHIIEGTTAPSYQTFSQILVALIIAQFYLIYSAIFSPIFQSTGKLPRISSTGILLMGVLSAISTIVMYTALVYFSTDGFSCVYK